MGYIRTPKGIDFLINSKPLSNEEKLKISEYIKESKKKYQISKSENNVA